MGIIRLEDKYKSKYKVQLTPERHYVSSSSGITGSVHVFPNRSATQKDNIDERLNLAPMALEGSEFSGAVVKPYDSNSLEARRIEIYKGDFGKFIGGSFTDALQYDYVISHGTTHPNGDPVAIPLNGTYTGEFINDEIRNDPNWNLYDLTLYGGLFGGGVTATRSNDGKVFTWQGNDVWVDSSYVIHNRLPESDRDTNGQNFEIALGMLLDGANPFTEDHAWRYGAADDGNSSYTNAAPEGYQFTGHKVFEDELGIPYLDSPVTRKEDINAWPPEVAKWSANVISNWVVKGYSDLSMHPRNATKKEVILEKADHNIFSSGSLFQRTLANRIDDLETHEGGWWVHNDHSLCLSKYTDGVTTYEPALGYWNQNDRYAIDWSSDEVTFEFWIKPCSEQTEVGTIVSLRNNFALTLIPDVTSISDGIYQNFMIGIHAQENVVHGSAPTIGDVHLGGAVNPSNVVNNLGVPNGGVYVTGSVLKLGHWQHVAIRYSPNFNNGLLNIYVDSVSITGGNVDGLYNGSTRTAGLFDTQNTATAGSALLVGGWPSTINEDAAWGEYSDTQEVRPQSGGVNVFSDDPQGFAVAPQDVLKSELKELRIWSETKTESELLANKHVSLKDTSELRVYIPFFFDPREDTPQWKRLKHTPFLANPKTPDEFYGGGTSDALTSSDVNFNPVPYCTNNAHVVGMPFVNVHSHLREYVGGSYPVIYRHRDYSNPSGSPYPTINSSNYSNSKLSYFTNHWKSFNWLRAINSMILPSDCERFDAKYDLVGDGAHNYLEKDYLSLEGSGVGSTSNPAEIATFFDDEVFAIQDVLVKIDPKLNTFRGTVPQFGTEALVAENKLGKKDFLSPLSTTIAVPQIYYGNRIHPDSIELKFVLNEDGKEITVVDFEGTLYRKDLSISNIASKVGHVDYGNGLICIFSPLLTSLGIENFDLKFKGEKNLHVMQLDIPCSSGVANKSQHPSYKKLRPSANANETESNLTYISSIYLHDENLNVIGKVNLAQPVQKREEDSFIFRVKVDF